MSVNCEHLQSTLPTRYLRSQGYRVDKAFAGHLSSPRCKSRKTRSLTRASAVTNVPSQLKIKYSNLGSSDLRVSEVCLGTMTFGEQNTEKEAHEQLNFAFNECGINFLDTAELYPILPTAETQGRTSEYIGSWLKNQKREDVIVATKVAGRSERLDWIPANRTVPRGEERLPELNAESIKLAVEGELRRLQTDHIDLLQLHWPDRYLPLFGFNQYQVEMERESNPISEQVEAIHQLIKEGKVRHWGLSNETSFGVSQHCENADRLGGPRPISIQNNFHLLNRGFESELAETCSPSNYNLGLLPWSAMAGGALSGKYLPENKDPEAKHRFDLFPGRYSRFETEHVNDVVRKYLSIADQANMTGAQLAYAFCRSRWYIPSTIIGATDMNQLQENMQAFSQECQLSDEILEEIELVHKFNRNPALID